MSTKVPKISLKFEVYGRNGWLITATYDHCRIGRITRIYRTDSMGCGLWSYDEHMNGFFLVKEPGSFYLPMAPYGRRTAYYKMWHYIDKNLVEKGIDLE